MNSPLSSKQEEFSNNILWVKIQRTDTKLHHPEERGQKKTKRITGRDFRAPRGTVWVQLPWRPKLSPGCPKDRSGPTNSVFGAQRVLKVTPLPLPPTPSSLYPSFATQLLTGSDNIWLQLEFFC